MPECSARVSSARRSRRAPPAFCGSVNFACHNRVEAFLDLLLLLLIWKQDTALLALTCTQLQAGKTLLGTHHWKFPGHPSAELQQMLGALQAG